MQQTSEDFISLLHKKGLKVTPQRLAIFHYLNGNENHPSAEIIYEEIKKDLPMISPGTVYKTLAMLTEIGLIREIKLSNGLSRYDSNTSIHINKICPSCNHIEDFQSEEVIEFFDKISNEIGDGVIGHRFDLYKKCSNCL
jgi:Fur family transcriptional regulator, peroxide stress response regulator